MSLSTYCFQYGRHLAQLCRRHRAYAPSSNTASHDNHEKIHWWVSFSFPYEYGAPLGGPLGSGSSAMRTVLDRAHRLSSSWTHFFRRMWSFENSILTAEFCYRYDYVGYTREGCPIYTNWYDPCYSMFLFVRPVLFVRVVKQWSTSSSVYRHLLFFGDD